MSDKLFFDLIRYRYDIRVFFSIRYDMGALGQAGGKSGNCSMGNMSGSSMGKVGSSVDCSTGGKVVGTSSGNGGLVGGDDRSVRVGAF